MLQYWLIPWWKGLVKTVILNPKLTLKNDSYKSYIQMKISNKHKTVEFWRRKTSILGNFRQLLYKKYQSDPLDILGDTRYIPCDCKLFFVLSWSSKLLKCCKTAKYVFYMIKSEKKSRLRRIFQNPPMNWKLWSVF